MSKADIVKQVDQALERASAVAVEHLTEAHCWQLLRAQTLGRLAVEGLDGAPVVFPINYVVHDKGIYIRSAPGSKLRAITARPAAAFGIDGMDDGSHWSVVVRGAARRMSFDSEIRASGVEKLISSSPTTKYHYVCITPVSVSGRRFAEESTRRSPAEVVHPRVDAPRSQPPVHIAHFPPQ